jgi:hypothetical protein
MNAIAVPTGASGSIVIGFLDMMSLTSMSSTSFGSFQAAARWLAR